ncbi:MAG: hypothetical protein Q9181_003597 [Wetmoreana brouardii]
MPAYVPAGSWCTLLSEIESSSHGSGCYEVVAAMTNVDNGIYTPFQFILPSLAPERPLSNHMVEWYANIEAFKVTLRQSIPGGWREFVRTSTPGDDEAPGDESPPKPGHGGSLQLSTPSSANQEAKQPIDCKTTDTNASKDHDAANPSVNDVPKHEETSEEVKITCPDPSSQLPPLQRTDSNTSALLIALDISNNHHNVQNIRTHLDWLDLAPKDDMEEIVLEYDQMSPRTIREHLEEAKDSGSKLTMPIPAASDSVTHVPSTPVNNVLSALDIDLDSIFGGQCATDLDDDEEIPEANEEDEEVDVVFSYAQSLLDNRRTGLPLSHYLPDSQHVDGSIWIAFQSRPFLYNGEGARLVASEVAYEYFRKGLETLREEGSVVRPMLVEADRSKDWFFQQPARAGKLPYDPRSCKVETLRHNINKSERTDAAAVTSRFEHFNFFRQRVQCRSTTPATVSLYAQAVCQQKPIHHCTSRQGVIMSQANKYIDPVYYDGPQELLSLEGTAFQDQTTGYVVKVNDPRGAFGDQFDGETAIRDLDDIDAYHLASQWHEIRMQQPYIMDHREHSQSALANVKINAPWYRPLQETYYKRNARGVSVHWDNMKVVWPPYIPSKFTIVHSLDDEEVHEGKLDIEEYSPLNPLVPGLTAVHHEDWRPEEITDDEAVRRVDDLFAKFAAGCNSLAQISDDHNQLTYTDEVFASVEVPLSVVKFARHDIEEPIEGAASKSTESAIVFGPTTDGDVENELADVQEWHLKELDINKVHQQPDSYEPTLSSGGTNVSPKACGPLISNTTTLGTCSRRVSGDSTSSYHKDTSDEEDHSSRATTPEVEIAATTDCSSSPTKLNVATIPSTAPAPQKPVDLQQITDCCVENTGGGSHSQHAGTYAAFIFGFAIAASLFW